FRDPTIRERIPDPNAESTFLSSKLNWNSLQEPQHPQWHHFYSDLLAIRQREIVPLLRENAGKSPETAYMPQHETGLTVCWKLKEKTLQLCANLGDSAIPLHPNKHHSIYSTFDITSSGEIP